MGREQVYLHQGARLLLTKESLENVNTYAQWLPNKNSHTNYTVWLAYA